jgi:hypothetical protein
VTRSTSIPWLSDKPPAGTPSTNKHTQIEVIEHKDFSKYPPDLLEKLRGADACIWSLGVSQNDVSAELYTKITKEYSTAAAKAFATLSDGSDGRQFKFIYVSGEGATLHPRPWTPIFGRVKGETERTLLEISKTAEFSPLLAVYSVRPGAVDGKHQPWIWKPIFANKRSAFQRFYFPPIMAIIRWGVAGEAMHSPTEELGRVLVNLAIGEKSDAFEVGPGVDAGGEGRTLGNKKLRMLGRGERQ